MYAHLRRANINLKNKFASTMLISMIIKSNWVLGLKCIYRIFGRRSWRLRCSPFLSPATHYRETTNTSINTSRLTNCIDIIIFKWICAVYTRLRWAPWQRRSNISCLQSRRWCSQLRLRCKIFILHRITIAMVANEKDWLTLYIVYLFINSSFSKCVEEKKVPGNLNPVMSFGTPCHVENY